MGIICATKPHAEGSDPEEEVNNIAETAAEPWNRLKENCYGTYNRHDRQGDNNERGQKLANVETYIFMTDKLHHDSSHSHDRDHHCQHGEVTNGFADGIKRFA